MKAKTLCDRSKYLGELVIEEITLAEASMPDIFLDVETLDDGFVKVHGWGVAPEKPEDAKEQ